MVFAKKQVGVAFPLLNPLVSGDVFDASSESKSGAKGCSYKARCC